jgi:hypothetical protein
MMPTETAMAEIIQHPIDPGYAFAARLESERVMAIPFGLGAEGWHAARDLVRCGMPPMMAARLVRSDYTDTGPKPHVWRVA